MSTFLVNDVGTSPTGIGAGVVFPELVFLSFLQEKKKRNKQPNSIYFFIKIF
jgi:hypothetical protein